MKDKKFLALSGLFFLLFFAGIAVITLEKPASQLLRAKDDNPSPLKSFAVVFPQVGVVGDKIKVSVYLRDVNGAVLANHTIKLSTSLSSVGITPSDTQITNNIGQAQFFITSTTSGKATLSATDIGTNTTIENIPTVEFTQ